MVRMSVIDYVWIVVAHAQKPDFVFRRNVRVHLNRRGRQFSRLLAAEVCASAVVMLDTPSSEVVWRVLATHFNRQFPLHFPSRASPCAIMFQLGSPRNNEKAVPHTSVRQYCSRSSVNSVSTRAGNLSAACSSGFRTAQSNHSGRPVCGQSLYWSVVNPHSTPLNQTGQLISRQTFYHFHTHSVTKS